MCVILLSDVSITENRNASTYLERILMNSRSDKLTETAEVWVPGVPAVQWNTQFMADQLTLVKSKLHFF